MNLDEKAQVQALMGWFNSQQISVKDSVCLMATMCAGLIITVAKDKEDAQLGYSFFKKGLDNTFELLLRRSP